MIILKVIFAPHCDDAYLSLGGSILEWRNEGEEVLVVNFFSKSGFTNKVSSNESNLVWLISHTRALEDLVNARTVGAKVEFLDLPEAPLRGHRKPWTIDNTRNGSLSFLRGKIDDSWLKDPITKSILKYAADNECYFPLGVGKHVDHVLLSEAAQKTILQKQIRSYGFYEDLSYAARVRSDIYEVIGMELQPTLQSIDWTRKEKLLRTYGSQLEGKYGLRIITSIESYHNSLGGCERIWLPSKR